jgi:hypothetical protein
VTAEAPAVEVRTRSQYLIIGSVMALVAAGLLWYSQTGAFAWDEGFHLLAAQLIKNGKRPYLDFFFPQSPLNAYWNAFWFKLFGDTWRTAHVAATLCTFSAILITGDYVYSRFPVVRWRFAGALAVISIVSLNAMIVEFGTVGQAYGLCLVCIMAAFRFTVLAVERRSAAMALMAGLMAGMASGASLLTVLAGPVMLLWLLIYNQTGSRIAKFVAFGVGNAAPFAPVLWLYLQKPREVLFTVFQFNYRYRAVDWSDPTFHDIDTLSSWLVSAQASMLLVLAIGGIFFVYRRSGWPRAVQAQFYLCAWISIIAGAHIGTAHPTFERYYLLFVPFVSIISVAALYWLGTALAASEKPFWPVFLAIVFFALGLGRALYVDEDGSYTWKDLEAVANKVNQVTPPGAPTWSEEHIYFLSKRTPPTGMEHDNSHKELHLSPEFIRALHILPRPEMERRLKAGEYSTVSMCEDSDRVTALDLPDVYKKSEEIGECTVYWDPQKP